MNTNRIGIITYRVGLIALISYSAITLDQINERLSFSLRVTGDVNATVKNTVGVISKGEYGTSAPLEVRIANMTPLNVHADDSLSSGGAGQLTPLRVEVVNTTPLHVEVDRSAPLDVRVTNELPIPTRVEAQ